VLDFQGNVVTAIQVIGLILLQKSGD